MTITMSAGVGQGAANAPIDVALIQDLLNRAMTDKPRLPVDGLVSGTLYERINDFQAALKKFMSDGRISPGGTTHQALQQKARAVPMNPALVTGSATWGRWSTLDVDAFVNLYKLQFNESFSGLTTLVTAIRDDPDVIDIRWAAYMLATAWKEAYDWIVPVRFEPVREVGHGKDHRIRDLKPAAAKEKLKFWLLAISSGWHARGS